MNSQRFGALLRARSNDVEVSGDILPKLPIEDADVHRWSQLEASYMAAVGHEREVISRDDILDTHRVVRSTLESRPVTTPDLLVTSRRAPRRAASSSILLDV